MKKLATIMIVLVFLVGCAGPRFSSEAQYNKGEWKGDAYLNEVAKIQRDKAELAFNKEVGAMSIAKLKAQPADVGIKNGVAQGFKGVVQNRNSYKTVQINIRHEKGYEVKSYVLGPKDWIEDYLLAGTYCVVTIVNGRQEGGIDKFTSGPRQSDYFGKKYHWFIYYPE